MKRRNADCKLRRPIKRNKITEGMYGSNTILYIKFLLLWAIVITADFMLEFRFEFLWPFWLLLRSVHDSFKFKGLSIGCFLQQAHMFGYNMCGTQKGICLPTIVLWMLFLYIEGAIRWKDSRHMPHLDLCRPFAAHCIGYPVVTLGFGFKSYVGFRMRQRKQREVAKENEFYMQLLQQALPQEEPTEDAIALTEGSSISVAATTATHNNGDVRSGGGSSTRNMPQKALSIAAVGATATTTTTTSNGHAVGASNGAVSSGYGGRGHHGKRSSGGTDGGSSSSSSNSKCDLNNHSNSKSSINHTSYHQQQLSCSNSSSSSASTSAAHVGTTTTTTTAGKAADKDVTRSSSDSLSGGSSRERDTCTQIKEQQQHKTERASHDGQSDGSPSSTKSSQSNNKVQHNGGINYNNCNSGEHQQQQQQQQDVGDVSSSTERGKNRRNRMKQQQKEMARDNHHHHVNGGIDGGVNVHQTNHNQTSQTLPQVCESCLRLEAEMKKMRSDMGHMKQIEHELRQKVESSATIKSCLQAKHKENDELEKKIQDLNNSRHVDRQNLLNAEKRLGEERRQRLTLESQLANERKIRAKIEEKAAKLAECGESCKMKKRHLESEAGRLRRELSLADEQKKSFEQQNRRYEDEVKYLNNSRHVDRQNLLNAEKRLGEERRQRLTLESQLANERKIRAKIEEKAAKLAECGESCKMKKRHLESEAGRLRRELSLADEQKKSFEQQNRRYEDEIRKMEDAQQDTEMLMSALAAMQDKNSTLEKNLSAETRFKLDLFSALGEARREVDIKDSHIRNMEKEILELKGKIAQLLAVMPAMPSAESFSLTPNSSAGSSMLRLNDTPPLIMAQQSPSQAQMGLGAPSIICQLTAAAQATAAAGAAMSQVTNCVQQQRENPNNLTGNAASTLDPNATAYTPKNSSLVGGTEA
uniref:Putative conserved plasma membrane protein n=1 Tax=Lutzomyia longipalpis TaxID=7200 RepID=A0A1B0CQT6_LUTLO